MATVVRELTDTWETKFGLLMRFREREGNCDVPRRHEEQGAQLGQWLNNQRAAWKKGTLGDERRRRLEEAGVTWDVLEAQWESSFALLLEYREREGNCDVPDRHEEQGAKLGLWLHLTLSSICSSFYSSAILGCAHTPSAPGYAVPFSLNPLNKASCWPTIEFCARTRPTRAARWTSRRCARPAGTCAPTRSSTPATTAGRNPSKAPIRATDLSA